MSDQILPKIDYFIIGAQKSGTTSLLRYLGEHPAIVTHPQKEFAFFLDPESYNHSLDYALNKYFPPFDAHSEKFYLAKNAPLYTRPEALKTLKNTFPDCKLIIILRDPVDRLYSSYLLERNAGTEKRDLEEIFKEGNPVEDEQSNYYFYYSSYSRHIKNIYSIFDSNQIKVIFYRDLRDSTLSVCKELFEWMGVDSNFVPNTNVIHNKTRRLRSRLLAGLIRKASNNKSWIKKSLKIVVSDRKTYKLGELARESNYSKEQYPGLSPELEGRLRKLFMKDIEELEKFTGKNLSFWKKK